MKVEINIEDNLYNIVKTLGADFDEYMNGAIRIQIMLMHVYTPQEVAEILKCGNGFKEYLKNK